MSATQLDLFAGASKACSKCGQVKALDEFYRDRTKKGGRRSDCKPCVVERSRRWREENREKELERKRRYHEENREKEAERNRRWRDENPEKAAERYRRWAKENPEKNAARVRRRRALEGGAPLTPLTDAEREDLAALSGGRCPICDAPTEHLDHVIPLAGEGPHAAFNLRWLCGSCNSSKHATPLLEWLPRRLRTLEEEGAVAPGTAAAADALIARVLEAAA